MRRWKRRRRDEAPRTLDLVSEVARKATDLVEKQIELARAELKADVRAGVSTAKGLGVAGVCGLCALNLLLVTAVLALAQILPGWVAGLIVTAAVLVVGTVAGLVGWANRVKNPMQATRDTVKENVAWLRERLA